MQHTLNLNTEHSYCISHVFLISCSLRTPPHDETCMCYACVLKHAPATQSHSETLHDGLFWEAQVWHLRHNADKALGVTLMRPVGALTLPLAIQTWKVDRSAPTGAGRARGELSCKRPSECEWERCLTLLDVNKKWTVVMDCLPVRGVPWLPPNTYWDQVQHVALQIETSGCTQLLDQHFLTNTADTCIGLKSDGDINPSVLKECGNRGTQICSTQLFMSKSRPEGQF